MIVDYYNGDVMNFLSSGGTIKNDYKILNQYELILQNGVLTKVD
jgi:hypothetical protein